MATVTRSPIGYFRGKVHSLKATKNPEYWMLRVFFEYEETPSDVLSDSLIINSENYALANACEAGKTYIFSLAPQVSQPNLLKNRPSATLGFRLLSAKSA